MTALAWREIEDRDVVYSADMEQDARREFAKIRKEIQELKTRCAALNTPPEPAKSSAPNWLQRNNWVPGAAVALIGSGFFGFWLPRTLDHSTKDLNTQVDERIDQKLKDHNFDGLMASVNQIQGQIKELAGNVNLLLGKNIKQVALLPPRQLQKQLPRLNGMLVLAAKEKVLVGKDVAIKIHAGLSELLVEGVPSAWNTILQLAAYESAFEGPPAASAGEEVPIQHSSHSVYNLVSPTGEDAPLMSAIRAPVAKGLAAFYEPIGVDLNRNIDVGNPFVFFRDGATIIDGRRMRNVVFINVHIIYKGGPLQMENVTFVNCRFSVENNKSGQQLLSASIASPTIAAFRA